MKKTICSEDLSFHFYEEVLNGTDPVEAFEQALNETHKINTEAVTYCGNCAKSKEEIDDPKGRIWCPVMGRYMDKKTGFCCYGEDRK